MEPTAYARTKLALLRAMRIKTELNPDIAERLAAMPDLDSQRVAMHAAVPVGAALFMSENGFCSGFAIRSGHQTFVMLPLEKAVAESMMINGVEPYFKEIGVEKQPEPQPQTLDLRQVQLLRDLNKKVFFASSSSLERFRELYGAGNEDVFVFDSYSAERNGEQPKSYLADLSRYAIPPGENNAFGAALSNVFTGVSQSGEQRYNVYIALSDGSSSRVIRFLSQPEETPDELIEASYEMLLDMIEEKCAAVQSGAQEGAAPAETEPVETETPAQQKTRRNNAVQAVVFTLLAVLIALAVLLFFHGVNNAKDSSAEAKQALAGNAAQREEENTDILSWFQAQSLQENAEGTEESTITEE